MLQARSEEESVALQAQLDIAGQEVERAHARLAALELEREQAASQVSRDDTFIDSLLWRLLGM